MANYQVKTLSEFESLLHKHGLKATKQRLSVHAAMMELGHASPDMVAEKLRENGASVTVSSIYNILSQLADKHIYSRRPSVGSKMYFDVNTFHHLHLYDRENDVFRDIVDEELMDFVTTKLRRRRFKGYTIEDIDIQLVARPTRRSKNV